MPIAACPAPSSQISRVFMSSHPFVRLALEAIQGFLGGRETITPPASLFDAIPEARHPGSAFVCLKLHGQLRGCIGTVHPTHANLALEVIHNAIGAAFRDPRFGHLRLEEAELLEVTVDILGPLESVSSVDGDLDPRRFGILVREGNRQGVLLPDIDGIATTAEQVAIARQKAGIGPDEPVELFRFAVTRYK
jgi:AmmeMemoRadiSam system protein A